MHPIQTRFGECGSKQERRIWIAMFAFLGITLMLATNLNAASSRVVITPSPGFSIVWDGNNGGFSSTAAGVGPSNNIALASNGTVPFTSSDLGPVLSLAYHRAVNLNDGLYGNSHSWISANGVGGTSDPNPFAGLAFASAVDVTGIAWSRDNGDTTEGGCTAGTCTDRAIGTYTLQFTIVPAPDATLPETEDASTGWQTIGTVQYLPGAEDINFTSYLRHRFDVSEAGGAINAAGLRIKVSDGSMDIDEIEVNPIPDLVPPISNFVEITSAKGYTIAWDRNEGLYSTTASPARAPENDASVSRGAIAFGSSELNFGVHFIHNVNDGFYGNTHSWIPDFAARPDPDPFIGINFGRSITLGSFAWGRDNGDVAGDCCGGTLKDRALGVYTIQVTTVPNPGVSTPEACGPDPAGGWVTIGTINYKTDNAAFFNSYLRHRFDVSAASGGSPIAATGLRIKVPSNQSDIDEIEVNPNIAIEKNSISISNAPGFVITWNGNDGQFNNPASGAAPPDNRALASHGTVPFTSSELGPVLNIPFHRAVNLNDGLYGNAHSWISANGVGGTSDPDPFAGLNFGGSVTISNIAWSRDNGDAGEGTFTDRAVGAYRLQFTMVDAPDATTPETGDASTGWADLGTVTYVTPTPPFFTPYLRHRFDIASTGDPLDATGIRIKVSNGNLDIDEIEINTPTSAPPPPPPVVITPSAGYVINWDGNDGQYNDPSVGAGPPANQALASAGTIPFTSSELGPALSIPFHRAVNLNDGLYGNAHSWIPDFINGDANPFAGLNFGGNITISNIAWSRDNGDAVDNCCGGTATDRNLGVYTIQVTSIPAPDASTAETGDSSTGWETVGTIEYRSAAPPNFNPHLRHRFDLSAGGAEIDATGLRIKVPNSSIDLDEIEVNTAAAGPKPHLTLARNGSNLTISWTGGGGLEAAADVAGPWTCLGDAASPYSVAGNAEPMQFYRVRR